MMNLTREILANNYNVYPEFEYYEKIIGKIESNVDRNPDIAIESSKSLLEGISKSIILKLESTFTLRKVNSMRTQDLFKTVCSSLSNYDLLEIDFINRTTSMIARIAELRNERGDISHGKAVPKQISSSKDVANMIMNVTDGIASYILKFFFSIDLSFKREVQYDDNPEFNEVLDEENPIDGISYSKALYEQDFILYNEQLSEFLTSREDE